MLLMYRQSLLAVATCLTLSAAPAVAQDLVVTQFGAAFSGAPYAIALDQGYFKEAGVDITGIVAGAGGGTTARNVMASELGYGEVVLSAALAGALEGQDIKIVNIGSRTVDDLVLLVKPNSEIRSLSQLAGKKVAFSNPKSLSEVITALAVEKAGLSQDKVQRIALGSLGATITALDGDSVDVAATLNIGMGARSQKFRILLDSSKDLKPMVQSVGVATGDLIRKNPEKLRAIIEARRKGTDFLYANPAKSIKILEKYFDRIKPDVLEKAITVLLEARHWSRGDFEVDRLNQASHGLRLVDALKADVAWDRVLDKSFLPADLRN
jgi:NitT/TauT family transport system substrate-binding protein